MQTHTQTRNSCLGPEPQLLSQLLHTGLGAVNFDSLSLASQLVGWAAPSAPPAPTARGPPPASQARGAERASAWGGWGEHLGETSSQLRGVCMRQGARAPLGAGEGAPPPSPASQSCGLTQAHCLPLVPVKLPSVCSPGASARTRKSMPGHLGYSKKNK